MQLGNTLTFAVWMASSLLFALGVIVMILSIFSASVYAILFAGALILAALYLMTAILTVLSNR